MATWRDLIEQRPDLAEAGRELLYQFGVGLGFLATIRLDTGPRVHPMCPILHDDRLLAFIIPSPKLEDLRRDGKQWRAKRPSRGRGPAPDRLEGRLSGPTRSP